MQINVFVSDILKKIAEKLNKTIQPKQSTYTDFFVTNDVSITSIMADRLATLIIADSDVEITGSKTAQEVLDKIANKYFSTKLKV